MAPLAFARLRLDRSPTAVSPLSIVVVLHITVVLCCSLPLNRLEYVLLSP